MTTFVADGFMSHPYLVLRCSRGDFRTPFLLKFYICFTEFCFLDLVEWYNRMIYTDIGEL